MAQTEMTTEELQAWWEDRKAKNRAVGKDAPTPGTSACPATRDQSRPVPLGVAAVLRPSCLLAAASQ